MHICKRWNTSACTYNFTTLFFPPPLPATQTRETGLYRSLATEFRVERNIVHPTKLLVSRTIRLGSTFEEHWLQRTGITRTRFLEWLRRLA